MKTKTGIFILREPAFNNSGRNCWKLDADGKIEMKDGNPIWIDANGGELTLGGDTISRLNGEAAALRKRAETAEANAKAFEGLDAEAARKAIDTVSKIEQKTLIDAGKVDEVRQQITAQFTAQIAEKDKALSELQSNYDGLMISNVFANSEFLRDRIAVPRDMFEATFRSNFKIEDGKVVVNDKAGNRLMSKAKIGEFADPAEALELLVEMHPQKDVILKASGSSGTGSGGSGGNRGGGNTIKRSDFEKLSPAQASETAGKVRAGEMTIVD